MLERTQKPLFILEMANNHMGDLKHAERIIGECAKYTSGYGDRFRFAFKFQHRDQSIIHPDYKTRDDVKMVKRLNDTRLTPDEFQKMTAEAKKHGFITICTPFDEESVKVVEGSGFDILKIASCSCADWPLMEAVSHTDMPVIFSTGGASIDDVDAMVTFMTNRKKEFAIMHCIGAYPTPDEQLQMNQIDLLSRRYPGVSIGFSTHEEPNNTDAVKIAIAKGCRIFERHVGLPEGEYSVNGYSSTPAQVGEWLAAAKKAFDICGGPSTERMCFSEKEICDLNDLYRGVYAKRDLAAGETINSGNVYYAMPIQEGQLASRNLSKYAEFTVLNGIKANGPVKCEDVKCTNVKDTISTIIKKMSKMLRDANVTPPDNVPMAISTHYGIDKFHEYGTILIDVLNREYCKKLLIMMPGQKHPTHYHTVKEETFHILDGQLGVDLEGEIHSLKKGDMLTVLRGQKHSFWSEDGAIIEEISTTSVGGDSCYDDERINSNPNRKFSLIYYSQFKDL